MKPFGGGISMSGLAAPIVTSVSRRAGVANPTSIERKKRDETWTYFWYSLATGGRVLNAGENQEQSPCSWFGIAVGSISSAVE